MSADQIKQTVCHWLINTYAVVDLVVLIGIDQEQVFEALNNHGTAG